MEKTFCELFAGVGGFRLGLEESGWDCSFSNQYEPSTKTQHASDIYTTRFGAENHANCDITKLIKKDIPDHTLLVGGFPCQDYSVAKPLAYSEGIQGKKGVLWWEIVKIIEEKLPPFILLENVNRLLVSPANARGRDFAIILSCLEWFGYIVEWRVINAADYGYPQRRKRIFIMAYQPFKDGLVANLQTITDGILGRAFPCNVISDSPSYYIGTEKIGGEGMEKDLATYIHSVSEVWDKMANRVSPFKDAGAFYDGVMYTATTEPIYDNRKLKQTLGDILVAEQDVPEEFFIKDMSKWEYLKGAKKEPRTNKYTGYEYVYQEGAIAFPDSPDKPSRTIITGEGGTSPSRNKHVVLTPSGRYRRLMPIELERLNGFPDEWTNLEGMSDTKRAFIMGNALVVGLIREIGYVLAREIKDGQYASEYAPTSV
jgi:DNA (cytosine-5)-methyltransferase 1